MPADILKINIDAVRAGCRESLRKFGFTMIETIVKAEFALDEAALIRTAGDADNATTFDPADLSNHRADRA